MEHGNITIHFRGKDKVPDVEVTHKKRFKEDPPENKDRVVKKKEFRQG
jgi:hypothetical protein